MHATGLDADVTDMEVSVQQEIGASLRAAPHVVLLGAGASRAALPNGDRYGRQVPLLKEVAGGLGLAASFPDDLRGLASDDFEAAYSQLYERDPSLTTQIDGFVREYFAELELPVEPTIYEALLLSLRRKDAVFTFNWDPFLVQARRRLVANGIPPGCLPDMRFLHGNVLVGYCPNHRCRGTIGIPCRDCGIPLTPSRLLFPVERKNYQDGSMIESEWAVAQDYLQECFMITVFGYSAPKTDVEAFDLLSSAWGDTEDRAMEQTEIIGRPGSEVESLRERWSPFIHTHHYEIHTSFYDSWIANHPRRTLEAFVHQYLEAQFIAENPVPQNSASVEELVAWFDQLLEAERRFHGSVVDYDRK